MDEIQSSLISTNNLREEKYEAFLEKTILALKENKHVTIKLKLIWMHSLNELKTNKCDFVQNFYLCFIQKTKRNK